MAVQTKAIKRRIKSVRNTRKITKAMELVAASKMRKAVSGVLGTRPFARLAWDVVRSVGRVTDTTLHPMLQARPGNRTLVILMTSDRGLAGGFNGNILKRTFSETKTMSPDFICVGKRGADAVRRAGRPMIASFLNITNSPKFEEVLPIGKLAVQEFLKGNYDRVLIAYTDFVSAITQKATVMQLMPLARLDEEPSSPVSVDEPAQTTEYKFEPNPIAVLDKLLPRLVETMVYQAVLESAASEHSARMLAMKNASESASEMIDALTFSFNQARQAGITAEIAEISSGKAALESN